MRLIIIASLLIVGCASTVQKPRTTESCYDYESCSRACKLYKDDNCNKKKYFEKD